MNWRHFQAFLWLRWRLRVNQIKRAGDLNAALTAILAISLIPLALMLFVGAFAAGVLVPPEIPEEYFPAVVLFTWDALVLAFIFMWSIGVLAELQRSDVLALDKFLHLPVSLSSAFLINYLASLFSINLLLFLPPMLGLSLGLIVSEGPAFVLLLPLLAAFLLATTALTYQFQGWLASLMLNKRRRRTIVVLLTLGFVLIAQLPTLINIVRPWAGGHEKSFGARFVEDQNALQASLAAGKVTPEEFHESQQKLAKNFQDQVEDEKRHMGETWQTTLWTGRLANMILPPGWLPLGAMDLVGGNVLAALLGTVGLTLIGAASLWRAYRTTLRMYTGQFTAGSARPASVIAAPVPLPAQPTGVRFLEREIPWLSEQAAAIALASFRSLLRAPESKMLLLSPLIMLVIFGSMMIAHHGDVPEPLRFLMVVGAMGMIMVGMVQFIGNQFGFDRAGFRVFVLTPASRRDILLGKNMAVAPVALGMGFVIAVFIEVVYPMRPDYFLASLVELVSMYFLFCVLANWLSILAPMPVTPGTMSTAKPGLMIIVIVFLFLSMYPVAVVPTLAPLGIAALVDWLEWAPGVPICLPLSLLVCAAILYLYRLVLPLQGRLLHAREQKILNVVTTKSE